MRFSSALPPCVSSASLSLPPVGPRPKPPRRRQPPGPSPASAPGAGGGGEAALRSTDGRLVITAIEAPGGIRVDGVIDDEAWERARPISGFVQSEPAEGQPATAADRGADRVRRRQPLHRRACCSTPADLVVTDIRKDFGDGRSGHLRSDHRHLRRSQQRLRVQRPIPKARAPTRRSPTKAARSTRAGTPCGTCGRGRWTDGWTVEMAHPVPLAALPGRRREGVGHQLQPADSPQERSRPTGRWCRGVQDQPRVAGGESRRLPARAPSRNLRIKPYVARRAPFGRPAAANVAPIAGNGDVGVDVKYGLTSALTLDLTVNPDFAQAEADQQQVNLTQFCQFFPEKRDFFLENSGVFYVGDASARCRQPVTHGGARRHGPATTSPAGASA